MTPSAEDSRRSLSPGKRAAFALLTLALAIGGLWLGAKILRRGAILYRTWEAVALNQEAWEAGYIERGLPVPVDGPRDGYWGSRIGVHVEDPELGWILPELEIPNLLSLDALGMQHIPAATSGAPRLLIMGASTAFGGYASSISQTYFGQLAARLADRGAPIDLTVYAVGGWKSAQELRALEMHGLAQSPDIVMFLSGLNDITNGANANVLYDVETETLDGSGWHALYHEHDYDARVRVYLENMRAARSLILARGASVVFVLQPALFEKRNPSELESTIEDRFLQFFGTRAQMAAGYEGLRRGLAELAEAEGVYFVDCSRVYGDEPLTVFTDMWHFSDVGHDRLAEALVPRLEAVVLAQMERNG